MFDDQDRPPLSEWLSGTEHANKFVLDQLAEEEKQLPGLFSYLVCMAVFGAVFWKAFGSTAAAVGLALIPLIILSYDADRRRADIKTRRAIEYQNGLIRSVYASQRNSNESALDMQRELQKDLGDLIGRRP